MTRYDNYSGSTGGSSNGSNDYDDTEVKLTEYATLRVTGDRVNAFNGNYGDKFIAGFTDAAVLDGVVLQRDDKPDTVKVFPATKFKGVNLNDEGVPVDDDGDELSAQDILELPYVQGFSETFGGDDYYYTPVGAVIEEADDLALNDDLDYEVTDDGEGIYVGEDISLMLSNKSWARKLGKLITEEGDDFIVTEENDSGREQPVKDAYDWMTTLEPTLREGIEGREMELFVIEESFQPDDADEPIEYTSPVLLDAKTGEQIQPDNASDDEGDDADAADANQEAEAVADGGATTAQSGSSDTSSPETTSTSDTDAGSDSTDESDASSDLDLDGETLPDGVPSDLEDLLDYFARTDGTDTTADDIRDMADGEVDFDDVDWDAAVAHTHARAENVY